VASGVALGLHFATWIASLSLPSIAASVLLVNTTPLFTLVFSRAFLGERGSCGDRRHRPGPGRGGPDRRG
jgi:drug/metabolite transporter (DMT)-like permease